MTHRIGFRDVPRTGVIYVMTEAAKRGFVRGDPDWANLGQGAPETGSLPHGPPRLHSVTMAEEDFEYAPVDGLVAFKERVAALYNARYRQGKRSQYTADNVAISAGGRLGLTRLVSTLGQTHVGHFLPDYTAYEELLGSFGTFAAIPVLLRPDQMYAFSADALREEIVGRGLGVVLMSNPCNPTGKLLHGDALKGWVDACRDLSCALVLDEFYSHYVYVGDSPTVSGAAYVEDVNEDAVIIIDGLTKNWRYPGFRVSWTIGPKDVIARIASAGSFLDGGCARPMQLAANDLVDVGLADAEAKAIQTCFRKKRDIMVEGLEALGIRVDLRPQGAFYCWGDLSGLAEGMNHGLGLFQKALEVGVIVVPGAFFDVNPGQRRADRPSRFAQFARFSFGPTEEEIERGLGRLGTLIKG